MINSGSGGERGYKSGFHKNVTYLRQHFSEIDHLELDYLENHKIIKIFGTP